MTRRATEQLLTRLERLKLAFGDSHDKQLQRLLKQLGKTEITDADSLIRLHETLLFLRAHPQSPATLRTTESLLRQFPDRIRRADEEEDLNSLDHPELSGIAGRVLIDTFSYYIVRSIVARYKQVEFYWEWFEDENRLGETWPRFMPLLEEDSFVEANIPYRSWLRAARGTKQELPWLIAQFDRLPLNPAEKAELYNSQKLYVEWTPRYRATRTGMRLPTRLSGGKTFYHREPLLQRRDISFANELKNPAVVSERLSKTEGETILDLARDASTTRYRELYGFTHGDPANVIRAHVGRGVDLFVVGLPAEKRLPLRAYHAAMIFKNRIPVGYFEALSLFERMESGFNLYYTFREGETGWLYAKTLGVMRQLLGVNTFVLDPYQIGFENEEGIQSGAFWFYRKLGFRSTDQSIVKLTEAEETKIRTRKAYRTPATTLRKLARAPMIFEFDKTTAGDWDRFQVRQIGFAIQREMARRFGGNADRMRTEAVRKLERLSRTKANHSIDFATVLLLFPDLESWSGDEKKGLVEIVQAKASTDEASYLRLMRKHSRFRTAIINLGSRIS